MSTIVKLVQGSVEWHEHRRRYRNASETPAVLGVSPWQTPYQLWQLKLGLIDPVVTPAMTHGSELEPLTQGGAGVLDESLNLLMGVAADSARGGEAVSRHLQ